MPRSSARPAGSSSAVIADPSPPGPRRAPSIFLDPSTLIPVYALLILAGYWFFHSGRATLSGNEMSRQRALFTVVNAATLTGFQQGQNSVNTYLLAGQAATLALIVIGILFSLIAGSLAVIRIARLPFRDWSVVGCAGGSVAAAAALGLALAPLRHLGFFASAFQTVSAWGNSGLFLGLLPAATDRWTHTLLLPLAALGGLGLPVLMELLHRFRRRSAPLSPHTAAVLSWSAGVYVIGAVLLLLGGWYANQGSASPAAWPALIATASAQAINTRSAGFAFSFATYWPRTVQWIAIGLMIIGAAPGGTAGGMKVTTLAVLSGAAGRALRRQSIPRALGFAITWLGLYVAMIAAALLLLLSTEPQMPADRILFLAASAIGNVGLSHDPLTVSDAGLYVLSAAMFAGRVAPILVLWWMAEKSEEPEVAIG